MERGSNTSNSAKDFVLEEALLSSSFFIDGAFVDITDVVTDIDIYEHLDKPYITGTVSFLDAERLTEQINFYGIEKFQMKVKLRESVQSVEKSFVVTKVAKNIRTNDSQSVILLHIIEDIGYLSEMQNVNKSYFGKGYDIISKIIQEYLGKELSIPPGLESDQDAQGQFGVVIPDMRPLRAADWIKDRITTADASPFYLFSTLANEKIHLLPLSAMLKQNPINDRTQPFMFSQAFTNTENLSIEQQAYIIEGHSNTNTEDLLKVNNGGLLNSIFAFHDVTKNKVTYPGHRADGNTVDKNRWTAFDMFEQRANVGRALGNPIKMQDVYPIGATLEEKGGDSFKDLIHQRSASKLVSNIYSTDLYDANVYSIGESRSHGEFLERLDSRGLRNWLVNTHMNFSVPGRNFLIGNANTTIGNKYNLIFLGPPLGDNPHSSNQIDASKSGEYLIYAARHSFTREGYTAFLTGTKIVRETSDFTTNYIQPVINFESIRNAPTLPTGSGPA